MLSVCFWTRGVGSSNQLPGNPIPSLMLCTERIALVPASQPHFAGSLQKKNWRKADFGGGGSGQDDKKMVRFGVVRFFKTVSCRAFFFITIRIMCSLLYVLRIVIMCIIIL